MRYFRDLSFYLLELIGSLLNLCGALVGIYPKLECGTSFLLFLENRKVRNQNTLRGDRRSDYGARAQQKKEDARALADE